METTKARSREKKTPSKFIAFSCIAAMFIILGIGAAFDVDAAGCLAVADMYVVLVGLYLGHSITEIGTYFREKSEDMVIILFIFAGVGFLISCFVVSGTIPTILYYAVSVISPKWCVLLSFIVCSFTAFGIGTSFGTAGTVGVCMVSVGTALGVNPLIMGGAVIGGSHVGLFLSPLSDNFNTSMGLVGTDAGTHLKRALYIGIPNFIMCIILYGIIGIMSQPSSAAVNTETLKAAISESFNVSPLALLPLLLVLILSFKKVPTVISLVSSGLFAIIFGGCILNGFNFFTCLDTTVYGVDIAVVLGKEPGSIYPMLNTICNRGGISSMIDFMCVISFGLAFAGLVIRLGVMDVIVNSLFAKANSHVGLVLSNIAISFCGAFLSGSSAVQIMLAITMLKDKWKSAGFTDADAGINANACDMLVVYVPWSGVPSYMASITGVSTYACLPYTFWGWGLILWSIITAIFKIGYHKNE